jgi:hypothetical protein
VHANARLRRIYFSDRIYAEEDLPPEFKLFHPPESRVRLSVLAPECQHCSDRSA